MISVCSRFSLFHRLTVRSKVILRTDCSDVFVAFPAVSWVFPPTAEAAPPALLPQKCETQVSFYRRGESPPPRPPASHKHRANFSFRVNPCSSLTVCLEERRKGSKREKRILKLLREELQGTPEQEVGCGGAGTVCSGFCSLPPAAPSLSGSTPSERVGSGGSEPTDGLRGGDRKASGNVRVLGEGWFLGVLVNPGLFLEFSSCLGVSVFFSFLGLGSVLSAPLLPPDPAPSEPDPQPRADAVTAAGLQPSQRQRASHPAAPHASSLLSPGGQVLWRTPVFREPAVPADAPPAPRRPPSPQTGGNGSAGSATYEPERGSDQTHL